MDQSVKEELVQTLERLSPEKLRAVLRFAHNIEQQAAAQGTDAIGSSDAEAERSLADFMAAAGCGHSGDPTSALRVDDGSADGASCAASARGSRSKLGPSATALANRVTAPSRSPALARFSAVSRRLGWIGRLGQVRS